MSKRENKRSGGALLLDSYFALRENYNHKDAISEMRLIIDIIEQNDYKKCQENG